MKPLKKLARMLTPPDPTDRKTVDRAVQERLKNIEKARKAGEQARQDIAEDQATIRRARNARRATGH